MTATTTKSSTVSDPTTASAPLGGRLTERSIGLLVVRLIMGTVFIGHGGQKLFGWWHGAGISGTTQFFSFVGYSPAKPIAVLSGLVEFGGGILLILGIGASAAAAAIAADMAGAVSVVHDQGHGAFFAANHGYELELTLCLVALGLTLTGAGRLALDDNRAWDRPVVRYGLAGLAVVGGLIAMVVR